MTEHVYVVARAGRCNGAALTVYADALSAISDARQVVADGGPGWSESDTLPQEPNRLYEAFGYGDEEWVVVTQEPIKRAAQTVINVQPRDQVSEREVAAHALRGLRWSGRA